MHDAAHRRIQASLHPRHGIEQSANLAPLIAGHVA